MIVVSDEKTDNVDGFPIPMRGNESYSCGPVALGVELEFPIPMRGNEHHGGRAESAVSRTFPIPMRGNELLLIASYLPATSGVSDPHEG